MSKTIMILGASILQLPAILQARKMHLNVVVVDMNPDAVGFSLDKIKKEVISTIDLDGVYEAAKKHNIDGILTIASDMPMRTVAYVSEKMNLHGISMDTAIKATNKYEMRKALASNNVPIPQFYRASNVEDYIDIIKKFDDKFITKPADNSGSRGIYLVKNKSEALSAFEYSKSFSRNGDILIEEYMEGPEVSVETLTINGVCHVIQVTDKMTTGAPHFVEMGHTQPSRLNHKIINEIEKVAIAANKAVGIKFGPSHTEIIVTKEGPKIVEIGARLGGDCITTYLTPLSTGVNMVECCIKNALGESYNIDKSINRGSAIRYFKVKIGTIKSYNEELLRNSKDVVNYSIDVKIGDEISDITSSSNRYGFVICQGYDADDAAFKAENIAKKFEDSIKYC